MPLNAHGLYEYAETDLASPFSDTLNLATDALTAVIASLKSRLATLEGDLAPVSGDSGWINAATTTFDPYSGGSNQLPRYRRVGQALFYHHLLKPKAASVSGITTTAGVAVCTLPTGYRPAQDTVLVTQGSGYDRATLTIQASGLVVISRYSGSPTVSTWLPATVTIPLG